MRANARPQYRMPCGSTVCEKNYRKNLAPYVLYRMPDPRRIVAARIEEENYAAGWISVGNGKAKLLFALSLMPRVVYFFFADMIRYILHRVYDWHC